MHREGLLPADTEVLALSQTPEAELPAPGLEREKSDVCKMAKTVFYCPSLTEY